MDLKTKKRFVRELCDNIRDEVISNLPRTPDNWDGRELREYLADKFEAARMPVESRKRRKAYRDFVLVNNL